MSQYSQQQQQQQQKHNRKGDLFGPFLKSRPGNLLKKRLHDRCFQVNFAKVEPLFNSRSPISINLFKVNNENTRAMCENCSKSTMQMPERRH